MINVEITLINNIISLTVPDGTTIEWIKDHYYLSNDVRLLAHIGGRLVKEDYVLKDGDKVRLFPLLGGG